MRRYETVFVANPTLSQEDRRPLFDKLTNLISDGQGLLVKFDDWGPRSLAYEIKKQTRGYYVLMDYCGDGALVKELERNLTLDDRLLKYMTVCTAKEVDLEAVQAEVVAAEAEAAKPAPEEEEPTSFEGQDESPPPETSEAPPHETAVAGDTSESSDEEDSADGKV